jgi:signal transduction histidine kinase
MGSSQTEASVGSGLAFFGKMSASISHEIKNVLAIINENAGLTEDLVALSERGRPLDPVRIKALAGKVRDQVKRGDDIVKNMNLFAHSVDRQQCEVAPFDLLNLSAALSRRLALIKGFDIELDCKKDIPPINTSPFLLYNLLWLFIERAMAEGGGGKLVMWAEESEGSLKMGVRRYPFARQAEAGSFPAEAERSLAKALGADLYMDASGGDMHLCIRRKPL